MALGVVMAAGGYPEAYDKGDAITGIDTADADPRVKTFHAGTRLDGDEVVTSGGRVLCVCALADNVTSAAQAAYTACENIHWDGAFYRHDIGYRAIKREQS